MITKDEILVAIKRGAVLNGGVPLGEKRFARETGISPHLWKGRYWARWSDALREAGLETRDWGPVGRLSDEALTAVLADLTRELGRFPTGPEMQLRRHSDPSLPHAGVFRDRFGGVAEQRDRVLDFALATPGYEAVVEILQPVVKAAGTTVTSDGAAPVVTGYVYLFKSGDFHKVGRSNHVGRRSYEVGQHRPEGMEVVHQIETDDPEGIEAYWHRRFEPKRSPHGSSREWFSLTADDVAAFKRRSYM